jgi:acyl dehydratase
MWSLAVLAALAASLSPESTIAVRLKASQLDYFMPPPAGDVIRFRIDARQAPRRAGSCSPVPCPRAGISTRSRCCMDGAIGPW